ncbi:MAG: adenylyltransferase/cytidyltransferase family protein [Chlamydiales bacterium]
MNSWQREAQKKFIPPEKLEGCIQHLRAQGKTIASLNGSFDLLHAGHLYMIFEASKVADILLIAVNSDASVKKYKGTTRPIISLPQRLEMLAALSFVDYLTWFDEEDPRSILQVIRPDIHVNGEEYGKDCIEADVVKRVGGKLHLVNRIPGLATSEVIEKILNLCV